MKFSSNSENEDKQDDDQEEEESPVGYDDTFTDICVV